MTDEEQLLYSAIHRYRYRSLELAATLAVFASSTVCDRGAIGQLEIRQKSQLIAMIQEFAFNCRKAIEQTEKVVPGILEQAKTRPMHLSRGKTAKDFSGDTFELTDQTFWWVINRLIHALTVYVKPFETNVTVYGKRGRLRIERSLNYIAFRSDYDDPNEIHHVAVDDLLTTFLVWIAPAIEQACNKYIEPLKLIAGRQS
jgi:hypothetical protein